MERSPCGHDVTLSGEQLAVVKRERKLFGLVGSARAILSAMAKAGSGKTTTAAALACTSAGRGHRVLALSFSKNGQKELVGELTRRHGVSFCRVTESHYTSDRVVVRTVDSLLAWALAVLGVPEAALARTTTNWLVATLARLGDEKLFEDGRTKRLWTRYNYDLRLRDVCDLVDRGKTLSDGAEEVLRPFLNALVAQARSENKITSAEYARVVREHAAQIAGLIEEHFDAVIVDECQDCSERDLVAIMELARQGRVGLAIFGDMAQSLMVFRGALGDVVSALRSEGQSVEELALTTCFRSTSELVFAANDWQVAAGWTGPLARPAAGAARGPRPLIVRVSTESQAVDVLVEMLAACGLARSDPLAYQRLGGEIAEAVASVARQVVNLASPRPPLVECIHRTTRRGDDVSSALTERRIDHTRVTAAANPYDSYLAGLCAEWFATAEDAAPGLRSLLVAHANRRIAGATAAAREELRACSDTVLAAVASAGRGLGRDDGAGEVLDVISRATPHSAVGDEGAAYLASTALFVAGYQDALRARTVASALDPFVEGLRLLENSQGRRMRGRVEGLSLHALVRELLGEQVRPERVGVWLSTRAARWRKYGLVEPTAGVLIKTGHGCKGDTCDLAAVIHAEEFPLEGRPNELAQLEDRWIEAHSEGYVPISRARYGLLLIAVGRWPKWYEPRLEGWDYLSL